MNAQVSLKLHITWMMLELRADERVDIYPVGRYSNHRGEHVQVLGVLKIIGMIRQCLFSILGLAGVAIESKHEPNHRRLIPL